MINTHNLKVDFGRHNGELYTRLPVSYLNWMVNSDHHKKDLAVSELRRRGTTMPTMNISGHAIDRFSQLFLGVWRKNRRENEGIHGWMHRNAVIAIEKGENITNGKYLHEGILWIFDFGTCYPSLKTVVKKNN